MKTNIDDVTVKELLALFRQTAYLWRHIHPSALTSDYEAAVEKAATRIEARLSIEDGK